MCAYFLLHFVIYAKVFTELLILLLLRCTVAWCTHEKKVSHTENKQRSEDNVKNKESVSKNDKANYQAETKLVPQN